MDVRMLELLEGAEKATGLTVIIDVFRAFSTASYAFANGAERIYPVGALDEAYALKRDVPDAVLIGERGGQKQPGFDFGNSPFEILHADLRGKTIIQTTSAGTQGIARARQADTVLAASFTTADAVVRYIRACRPETVSLVAMGGRGIKRDEEDVLCARYIESCLQGSPLVMDDIIRHIRRSSSAAKFFDPTVDWAPEQDFDLCLNAGAFNFVLKLDKEQPSVRPHLHCLST